AVQVRAFARAVDTAARAIVATRTSREAAERNLEAERRRYENGMTTNFQVLEIQQQLTDARVRELNAVVEYNQAVSAYQRATGDILAVRNIVDEEPVHVVEPKMFSFLDKYNWLNYGSRVREERANERK
ncbi:MAG TPA: TolC family protein, partial [Thermoanaerobaculia bacterium]